MTPKPNNGTLRLPFKPIGTHKSEDEPKIPQDPVTSYSLTSASSLQAAKTKTIERPSVPPKPTTTSSSPVAEPTHLTSTTTTSSVAAAGTPTQKPQDQDGGAGKDEDSPDKPQSIWDWFSDKFDKVWHKITGESKDSN